MSALETLSVASNVFQVIGFANTVFRAGKNLYELFDKARSASRNIAWLLIELQALLRVVAHVRIVIAEHASSPFAQDDGYTLPNVDIVLTLIEQDFRHLTELLGQPEIAASRQRFAQYTQNLTLALTVSGRRNDIAVRTKLQSIEDRIQASSQSSQLPPLLGPTVDTRPPNSRRTFRVPRRQARATCALVQSRSSPQSSLVKADGTPIRLDGRKDNVITRSTADFNDPHLSSVSYSRLKINVYEQEDQSLFLDTGNHALDQITKPAVFLRDSLIASLNEMRTNRIASISEALAEHLQMLFDFLVASAHTASVDSITKQYNISSRTKLLDRSFPTSESKGMIVQRGGAYSSSIVEASLPTSLEEISMTLNTVAGTVKAKILSARSYTDATTLAITFEYLGDASLGLSAFAVDFISHELVSCFHVVSCFYLSNPIILISMNDDLQKYDHHCRRNKTSYTSQLYPYICHISILAFVLDKLQHNFKSKGGSDKCISAFIAIIGLAMPHEDAQKMIHIAVDAKLLRGDMDAQRGHVLVNVACDDIDKRVGFIQQPFWGRYGNYNWLRVAEQDWVEVAFKDVNSVEFVKNVASLAKENMDFLSACQHSPPGNTTRLVADFLLSYWPSE